MLTDEQKNKIDELIEDVTLASAKGDIPVAAALFSEESVSKEIGEHIKDMHHERVISVDLSQSSTKQIIQLCDGLSDGQMMYLNVDDDVANELAQQIWNIGNDSVIDIERENRETERVMIFPPGAAVLVGVMKSKYERLSFASVINEAETI